MTWLWKICCGQTFREVCDDTVQDYLCESHERQKGLAGTMVKNDFELTAPTAKLPRNDATRERKVKFRGETKAGQDFEVQFGCRECGQVLLSQGGLTGKPGEDFLCERCRNQRSLDADKGRYKSWRLLARVDSAMGLVG